ncbi:MAG: DUF4129 domain-containing protein [Flavobacteriales bacterium]|nr:DUF4129 domain-containing protein [Flavobacteriales bacterium]
MGWIRNKYVLIVVFMLLAAFAKCDTPMPEDDWKEVTEGLHYETREDNTVHEQPKSFNLPEPKSSPVFMYAALAVLAILVLFLITRILSTKPSNRKVTDVVLADYAMEDDPEDLQEHPLEDYLKEAISKGDYRAAIRISYLMILQKLDEQKLIEWQLDKTNRDYQRELGDHPEKATFRRLTLHFEYAWYGEVLVEQSDFDQVSPLFDHFLKQITKPSVHE